MRTGNVLEKENVITLTDLLTSASGKTAKGMVRVVSVLLIKQGMKELGKKILSMEKVF